MFLRGLEARFDRGEDVLSGSVSPSTAPRTNHYVRIQQRASFWSQQLRGETGPIDFGYHCSCIHHQQRWWIAIHPPSMAIQIDHGACFRAGLQSAESPFPQRVPEASQPHRKQQQSSFSGPLGNSVDEERCCLVGN